MSVKYEEGERFTSYLLWEVRWQYGTFEKAFTQI